MSETTPEDPPMPDLTPAICPPPAAPPAPPTAALAEFAPARWHAPLYVAAWLGVIAAIWVLPALPTQDGPSHLYFLGVLGDLLAGRGPWLAHYVPDLQLRPYLGFVAIGLPLSTVLGPVAVERAFVSLYALVLALGLPALLKAFGRPALPLAFVALPLAVNYGLCLGFYSFSLGAALGLPALALMWRARDRRLAGRVVVATALAAVIWTVHLVPAAIVVVAAGLLELTRPGRAGHAGQPPHPGPAWPARTAAALAVTLPAAVAMLALVVSNAAAGPLVVPAWHAPIVLAFLLFTAGIVVLGPGQLWPAFALGAWVTASVPWRSLGRDHACRWLGLLGGLLALAVVLAPNAGLSGAYLNERLAWMVLLLWAPLARPWRVRRAPWLGRHQASALAAIAVLALFVTWRYVVPQAATIAAAQGALGAALEPGSTVLLARYEPRPLWPLYDPLAHVAGWYGRAGLVDIAYDEAGIRYFPVRLRSDRRQHPDPDRVYETPRAIDWSGDRSVDYLLAWGAEAGDRAALDRHFRLVWQAADSPLTVWRRRSP